MSQKNKKWIPWGVGYLRNDQMPFDGVVVSGETLWSRQKVGSKEFILCHVGSLNIWPCLEYPKSQGFIFELKPEDSEAAVQLSLLPLTDDLGSLSLLIVHSTNGNITNSTSQNYTTEPQTLRFSSYISSFWTLPEQLSMLHHAFVPTHPEPTSQRYTTKPQTLRFSSHTSLFWTLPEQLYMLHHAFVPTHPEPTSQRYIKIHQKTSDPKIFILHPRFELCRNSSPCYTTHLCQPILNQRPKDI